MLLCEQLFLLLYNDDGKREYWTSFQHQILAAGVLADLAKINALSVAHERRSKVVLNPSVDVEALEHPVLRWAMYALKQRKKPERFTRVIQSRWFRPRDVIGQSFVDRGLADYVPPKMLGMMPPAYVLRDRVPERALRERLVRVLQGSQIPTTDDLIVLSTLHAASSLRSVFKHDHLDMTFWQAQARGKELQKQLDASGSGSSVRAVIDVVNATNAAVMAGAISSTMSN